MAFYSAAYALSNEAGGGGSSHVSSRMGSSGGLVDNATLGEGSSKLHLLSSALQSNMTAGGGADALNSSWILTLATTAVSAQPEGDEGNNEQECKLFTFVVYVLIFGSMCVFGLIGNTLSFVVLQWESRGSVATFLLQAMAVFDNLFLLTTGVALIYPAWLSFMDITDSAALYYMRVSLWPLVYITQLGTIWITILIAFNRYIAICRPFQAHRLCTMRRVRMQILSIVVFIIVYNIPRFFDWKIVHHFDPATNTTSLDAEPWLRSYKAYNYIYEILCYCLFYFLGPMVTLIAMNTCLMQELLRARQRLLARHLPASMTGEDQENSLTLVMIVIILIFLFTQAPASLNSLLDQLENVFDYSCGKPYFYYYHISNLLASANSCVNFVVYCVFRKQFRERLYACCRRDHDMLHRRDMYNYTDGRTASVYSRDKNVVNL